MPRWLTLTIQMEQRFLIEIPEEKVTIIIVTFNTLEYVKTCIESILANTAAHHEIIVVDNASAAPTRDYVASMAEQDKIIAILNDENRLWSAGNNQGLQAASKDSQFLLLLNSDVKVLRPTWLKRLQRPMHLYPQVGISGTQYNFFYYRPNYGAIDGCCFMIRKPLLDQVGLLDENYPWNGAGFAYTVKAWAKGWFYYHVEEPDLLIHYGKRSRISNQTQLVNQKIDMEHIYQEAGLVHQRDHLAMMQNYVGRFKINKKIGHLYRTVS